MHPKHALKLEIYDGGGAAWRARYVYLNGEKIAHIGVDPNGGVNPTCFGSLVGKDFRFKLPTVPWRFPASETYLKVYAISSKFWHAVDGRYGWGTKYWRGWNAY